MKELKDGAYRFAAQQGFIVWAELNDILAV
jgi:hypothetical protein